MLRISLVARCLSQAVARLAGIARHDNGLPEDPWLMHRIVSFQLMPRVIRFVFDTRSWRVSAVTSHGWGEYICPQAMPCPQAIPRDQGKAFCADRLVCDSERPERFARVVSWLGLIVKALSPILRHAGAKEPNKNTRVSIQPGAMILCRKVQSSPLPARQSEWQQLLAGQPESESQHFTGSGTAWGDRVT
eukprot:s363_g8.t1